MPLYTSPIYNLVLETFDIISYLVNVIYLSWRPLQASTKFAYNLDFVLEIYIFWFNT